MPELSQSSQTPIVVPEYIAGQLGTKLLASVHDAFEWLIYTRTMREVKQDPHICWGENLHVLIISDRCGGRVIGIYEY